MSQIKLYLDEDAFARRSVNALRSRGIDVLTAIEAKMINRDDEEHLDFAAAAETRRFTRSMVPIIAAYKRNGCRSADRTLESSLASSCHSRSAAS